MKRHLIIALVFAAFVSPAVADDFGNLLSAGARSACRIATQDVARLFPALEKRWSDNNATQQALAQVQDALHLASLPLQNSDCAEAGRGSAQCVALNEAYNAAREKVLAAEVPARQTAAAYAVSLAGYQSAASAATKICQAALAADALRGREATEAEIKSIIDALTGPFDGLMGSLGSIADVIATASPSPPAPVEVVIPTDGAPAKPDAPTTPDGKDATGGGDPPGVTVVGSQDANLTWEWQFKAHTFNGSYAGDFSSWTFKGAGGLGDFQGAVSCTGHAAEVTGIESGGGGEMDCTADFPATATHGAAKWQGHAQGRVNWDDMLLKAGGKGTRTDDKGVAVEDGIDALYLRPGHAQL